MLKSSTLPSSAQAGDDTEIAIEEATKEFTKARLLFVACNAVFDDCVQQVDGVNASEKLESATTPRIDKIARENMATNTNMNGLLPWLVI